MKFKHTGREKIKHEKKNKILPVQNVGYSHIARSICRIVQAKRPTEK